MMVRKSSRLCGACGEPLDEGKYFCRGCGEWTNPSVSDDKPQDVVKLSAINRVPEPRIKTGPWDFALGGGLKKTSTMLLGGPPGAGKTTFLLKLCQAMIHDEYINRPPLYILAEQSLEDIADYADRLHVGASYGGPDINMVPALQGADVGKALKEYKPSIAILDSLQGLIGKDDAGQIDFCKIAKVHAIRLGCPFIMISHVTKDEMLAGTMTLQHEVDVTAIIFVEDDYRVFTTFKSRIGPAFFESRFLMTENGLAHVGNRKPGDTELS